MNCLRKSLTTIVTTTAMAAALLTVGAGEAAAGHCPDHAKVTIPGEAAAEWNITCSLGSVTIRGWFRDLSDGDGCARVRIRPGAGDWEWAYKMCDTGPEHLISRTYKGHTSIEAELFVL
ncbi:hypothetical protein [Streptomyces althioticus]|uniref:hypothetical protein n=1 Tax=Streptomyces althioticus TaxID=83380 RepID=UPI00367528F6